MTNTAEDDQVDIRFLVEETRRREDILDATVEALTRKAYFAFTLATTIVGFYLSGIEQFLSANRLVAFASLPGSIGIGLYVCGAIMFWKGHTARDYDRVPNPDKLVEEWAQPSANTIVELNQRRAIALQANLSTADKMARSVNIQHDFLLLQIGLCVASWILFRLGY